MTDWTPWFAALEQQGPASMRSALDACLHATGANDTAAVVVAAVEGEDFRVVEATSTIGGILELDPAILRGKLFTQLRDELDEAMFDLWRDGFRACVTKRDTLSATLEKPWRGGTKWIQASLHPVFNAAGEVTHIVDVAVDRTSERDENLRRAELEDQMLRTAQLEIVGRLAAGVAHDFNNILTAIIGNTALLRVSLDQSGSLSSRVDHIVDEIDRAGERASALVRQLLTFTDQRNTSPDSWRLDPLLRDGSRIVSRLLPESVEVVLELRSDAVVRIDRALFEQALVNLAVNASDAMPLGGTLTFTSELCETDEGMWARVSVRDNGDGMSEATRARVFEPFFTTKPQGKGTGLGLPNVKRTIEQAEGRVVAQSTLGEGTTIEIWLPAAAGPGQDERISEPIPNLGGREAILLCEDDLIVRESLVGMLEQGGYRVQSAAHPQEALRKLDHASFDLVVSDVVMPGMSGVDFAKRVWATLPDMPVLFISGYSRDVLAEHGLHEGDVDLLPKPFDYATLMKRVKRALERARAA